MKPYPSAADWWVVFLIVLGPLICFVLGIYFVWMALPGAAILFLSGIFSAGLILAFLSCEYTLEEEHLLVRSGIIRKRFAYKTITKIQETNCPLSAPALSLRRISIQSTSGSTLISPVRKNEFLNELQARIDQS